MYTILELWPSGLRRCVKAAVFGRGFESHWLQFFLRPPVAGCFSGALWQSLSLNGGRRRSSGVVERGEVQGRPKSVTTTPTPTNSRAILFVVARVLDIVVNNNAKFGRRKRSSCFAEHFARVGAAGQENPHYEVRKQQISNKDGPSL